MVSVEAHQESSAPVVLHKTVAEQLWMVAFLFVVREVADDFHNRCFLARNIFTGVMKKTRFDNCPARDLSTTFVKV